ncbi:hypothetical protein [Noviherbaspirillum galbum]|uniref:hypothetical protein n=1 Tax=Noviherbaspirillum galbum TaxID=2709383 RepID=UPI001969F909|nr:hypothetical protein [Noviherbaspirillum galbum]
MSARSGAAARHRAAGWIGLAYFEPDEPLVEPLDGLVDDEPMEEPDEDDGIVDEEPEVLLSLLPDVVPEVVPLP